MPHVYFSERENGPCPRVVEEISLPVWKGLHAVIFKWYLESALCGTDHGGQNEQFHNLLAAEIPTFTFSFSANDKPSTHVIFDLIEFTYKNVLSTTKDHYELYQKYPYESHREIGRDSFRDDINLIFKRNGIIYELTVDGSIERLVPQEFQGLMQQTEFHTGDTDLDNLLNDARTKFRDPELITRKDALEKLWDAWERLKTIEPGNKRTSITTLLEKTSPEINFRQRLDGEATELTDIGNKYRIRHHEMDKIPIGSSEHVDYLFYRMFSLIYLILKSTNRVK